MDRLLLLLPTRTYRTEAFVEAARKLALELVSATEEPSALAALSPDHLLTLDFADPASAAAAVAAWSRTRPVAAVVGADDTTAAAAAAIAQQLGLVGNAPQAVAAARDKHQMRQCLAAAGVRVPRFRLVPLDDDPRASARTVGYPCVLKPLSLSASRGVIRVNHADQFVAAHRRIAAILARPDVAATGTAATHLLAEAYVPGLEVALEGLLRAGTLEALALFDKPDPLEGPFFEETIYVTPSRLPAAVERAIVGTVARACGALGLTEGPVHAELRVNEDGPWVLEVAPRTIGGFCSRALRVGTGMSLEEVVLLHALGRPIPSLERERQAAGVMMLPIPRAGRLGRVEGSEAARAVDGIEDLVITAHPGQELVPLPEGGQYLGFLFARGETPEAVEQALRVAHARLAVVLD